MSKPPARRPRRLRQRQPAGQHAAQVVARHQAQLHVDVGEAQVAVEQQGSPAEPGQRVRQSDREPGLADAALARCYGDDAARLRPSGGAQGLRGGDVIGGPFRLAAGARVVVEQQQQTRQRQRADRAHGSAACGPTVTRRRPAPNVGGVEQRPSRRATSSRVAIIRRQPTRANAAARSPASIASAPAASTSTGSARACSISARTPAISAKLSGLAPAVSMITSEPWAESRRWPALAVYRP